MATWEIYIDKFGPLFILVILWTLLWKGYALWTAAKQHQKGWFVVLLVVNTVGILDIIYIFYIAKKSGREVKRSFVKLVSLKK